MYSEFYGLSGRPFQLAPDPKFYFESLTHRKALSYLSYGLAQGEGFVVITGEVGAGKSTLVAHLMATIDPARLTAAQIVTSALDGSELVQLVAESFGLEVEGRDKVAALATIEAFLHDEARAGRRCLLVVDESQNLTFEALEELRMLSNFQLGSHPLLQTLLLGQPEFRETIQQHPRLEQLRQRVIAAHHLEAMEQDEVGPYIEHRLKRVGWNGRPRFEAGVYDAIYQATGGVPRRINQLCNRVLLMGAIEQKNSIDVPMLNQVLNEFEQDGTMQLKTPQAEPGHGDYSAPPPPAPVARRPAADAQQRTAAPVSEIAAPAAVPGVALAQLQGMLAQRDNQIAELQQAVIELSAQNSAPARPDTSAFEERLNSVEARLFEQERTIRHTLTMLIEWIEADNADRDAA